MEVVLCSDHDFSLFKDMKFKLQHEIRIDSETNMITHNSGYNLRYGMRNTVSIAVFLGTFGYISYLYNEFSVN